MTHSPTPRYLSIQPFASLFSVMLSRLGLFFAVSIYVVVIRGLKCALVCSSRCGVSGILCIGRGMAE